MPAPFWNCQLQPGLFTRHVLQCATQSPLCPCSQCALSCGQTLPWPPTLELLLSCLQMCQPSAAALVPCARDPLECSFEFTFLNVSVVEIFNPDLGFLPLLRQLTSRVKHTHTHTHLDGSSTGCTIQMRILTPDRLLNQSRNMKVTILDIWELTSSWSSSFMNLFIQQNSQHKRYNFNFVQINSWRNSKSLGIFFFIFLMNVWQDLTKRLI